MIFLLICSVFDIISNVRRGEGWNAKRPKPPLASRIRIVVAAAVWFVGYFYIFEGAEWYLVELSTLPLVGLFALQDASGWRRRRRTPAS